MEAAFAWAFLQGCVFKLAPPIPDIWVAHLLIKVFAHWQSFFPAAYTVPSLKAGARPPISALLGAGLASSNTCLDREPALS